MATSCHLAFLLQHLTTTAQHSLTPACATHSLPPSPDKHLAICRRGPPLRLAMPAHPFSLYNTYSTFQAHPHSPTAYRCWHCSSATACLFSSRLPPLPLGIACTICPMFSCGLHGYKWDSRCSSSFQQARSRHLHTAWTASAIYISWAHTAANCLTTCAGLPAHVLPSRQPHPPLAASLTRPLHPAFHMRLTITPHPSHAHSCLSLPTILALPSVCLPPPCRACQPGGILRLLPGAYPLPPSPPSFTCLTSFSHMWLPPHCPPHSQAPHQYFGHAMAGTGGAVEGGRWSEPFMATDKCRLATPCCLSLVILRHGTPTAPLTRTPDTAPLPVHRKRAARRYTAYTYSAPHEHLRGLAGRLRATGAWAGDGREPHHAPLHGAIFSPRYFPTFPACKHASPYTAPPAWTGA